MSSVIEVAGMTKRFGTLTAVNDISFHVERGGIFGLLGKNGAGKTTTVEILEGYQTPDAGAVQVLGINPATTCRSGPPFCSPFSVTRRSASSGCGNGTCINEGHYDLGDVGFGRPVHRRHPQFRERRLPSAEPPPALASQLLFVPTA